MVLKIIIVLNNTSLLIIDPYHIRPFMDIQPSDHPLILLNYGKQILPGNVFFILCFFRPPLEQEASTD